MHAELSLFPFQIQNDILNFTELPYDSAGSTPYTIYPLKDVEPNPKKIKKFQY